MFTNNRRKKNYQTFIYSAIIVTLCLLIVAVAWPENVEKQPSEQSSKSGTVSGDPFPDGYGEEGTEANAKANAEDNGEANTNSGENDSYGTGENNDSEDDEKDNISGGGETYYLVKKADGQVKVFFVNEAGKMFELETTGIVYDVLSTEDQKLFDEGFRVRSQEELAVLLQDFES